MGPVGNKWAKSLRVALVCALGLVASCAGIQSAIEKQRVELPTEYVVIVPEGRATLASVSAFLRRKSQEGFAVSVLEFSTDIDPASRVTSVQESLRRLSLARRYALIIASVEELPMGPWQVEGLEEPIESDLPFFLTSEDVSVVLTESAWQSLVAPDFSSFVGRVPFSDEDLIASALENSAGSPESLALLGSERFAVWWDTAWVMSRARKRFGEDWSVLTYGEDAPSDVRLGSSDLDEASRSLEELRTIPEGAYEGAEYAETLLFASHWAHLAPSVVYLNSHGSSFFGVEVGDFLLSELKLDRWAAQAQLHGLRSVPKSPAVLVVVACKAGPGDSALTERLFAEGWVSALVASTELTEPTPLFVAIRAEIDTASVLNSNLPLGVGLHVVRQSYLEDADDSLSFLMSGSVRAAVAKNLLGLTLYGDPSRRIRQLTSKESSSP